jgi:hypothetical protein
MARCAPLKHACFVTFAGLLMLVRLYGAGATAEQAQGILEVRVKDHREAIDDFARLDITIDKILLSPKAGLRIWQTAWQELPPSTATLDLTQYIDQKTARVFRGGVDARAFDAFHLRIGGIRGVLRNKQKPVTVKNAVGPVKLPFRVPERGETLLVLDLVVTDLSDHPPRGYELSIKGLELFTDGKLVQRIPPG